MPTLKRIISVIAPGILFCALIFIITLSNCLCIMEIVQMTYPGFMKNTFDGEKMTRDIVGIFFGIIISEFAGADAKDNSKHTRERSIAWAAMVVSLMTAPTFLTNSSKTDGKGQGNDNFIVCVAEAISEDKDMYYNILYIILIPLGILTVFAAYRFQHENLNIIKTTPFTRKKSLLDLMSASLFLSTYIIINHTLGDKTTCIENSRKESMLPTVFLLLLNGLFLFLAVEVSKLFNFKKIGDRIAGHYILIYISANIFISYIVLTVLGKIVSKIAKYKSIYIDYFSAMQSAWEQIRTQLQGVLELTIDIVVFVAQEIGSLLRFIYDSAMGYPTPPKNLLVAFIISGIIIFFLIPNIKLPKYPENGAKPTPPSDGGGWFICKIMSSLALATFMVGLFFYIRNLSQPDLPFTNIRVTCEEQQAKNSSFYNKKVANLEFNHCKISWPFDDKKCTSQSIVAIDYNNASTQEIVQARIESITKTITSSFKKACSGTVEIPTIVVLKLKPGSNSPKKINQHAEGFGVFISDFKPNPRNLKALVGNQIDFGNYKGWEIIGPNEEIH